MRFRVVLFDLDGTLVDSGPIILASFRHATQTVLKRTIPDAELMAHVGGHGLYEQMKAFDADRVDELVSVYSEHNAPLYAGLEAFPGVEDALRRLKDEGRQLGVVTTKRRQSVEICFSTLPLRDYFVVVVTSEDSERHKPHPDPILKALERLGAEPADAAYVGDAPFDVEAAKAAGVHAIAVTWGGIHTDERLEAERPDAIVHDVEELLAAL
jgi:pyrophosphatase PpaX